MQVGASMLQNQGVWDGDGRPDRRATRDWVLMKLYEGIFSRQFRPGVNLSEAELSKAFDVSRQPVREALRQLENDGLVTAIAGNGARSVVTFDRSHVVELYSMREALEAVSFRHAAQNITSAQLKLLNRLQRQFEGLVASGGPAPGAFDATPDFRFHHIVAEAAGMQQLHSFLVSIWLKTWALLSQLDVAGTYPNLSELRGSYRDRRELLDALKARDADTAANCASRHVRNRMHDLLTAIDSGRGSFRLA